MARKAGLPFTIRELKKARIIARNINKVLLRYELISAEEYRNRVAVFDFAIIWLELLETLLDMWLWEQTTVYKSGDNLLKK
jgi:hypothetical protein